MHPFNSPPHFEYETDADFIIIIIIIILEKHQAERACTCEFVARTPEEREYTASIHVILPPVIFQKQIVSLRIAVQLCLFPFKLWAPFLQAAPPSTLARIRPSSVVDKSKREHSLPIMKVYIQVGKFVNCAPNAKRLIKFCAPKMKLMCAPKLK